MSKEPYNQHQFWVLGRIKEKCESAKSNIITYNLASISARDGAPDSETQRDIIFALQRDEIIHVQPIYGDNISIQPKAVRGGFAIEPIGFKIKILHPQFDNIFSGLPKTTAPIKGAHFDTTSSILTFEGVAMKIKPYKNEHYFCKVVLAHDIGDFASWDEIYEEMTEKSPDDIKKERKAVMDTMQRLNERIAKEIKTNKILFPEETTP
jgi:hypothetical protein